MSDNAEQERSETKGVEQITKVPNVAPKREKDPKRVAAGKKLAESNKRMREEHARYKASEEERQVSEAQRATDSLHKETEPETETGGSDLLSQLSLTNIISLVGIGLTVYAIFFKKSGNTEEKHVEWKEPVETTFESPEVKQQPQPKTKVGAKPSTKPRPKFGM